MMMEIVSISTWKATTVLDEKDQNKVNLEGVVAIIDLKIKVLLTFSKNAVYDKSNNTLFLIIRAEYLTITCR